MTTSYLFIEYVLSVISSQLHSIPHGVLHNLPKLWPLQSQDTSLLPLLQTWAFQLIMVSADRCLACPQAFP